MIPIPYQVQLRYQIRIVTCIVGKIKL